MLFRAGLILLVVVSKMFGVDLSESELEMEYTYLTESASEEPERFTSSFYHLPISSRDEEIISKVVRSLAEKSLAKLLWKKSEMESMGKKINHVHPMRFLGHVFSHPEHVHHLRQIKKSTFKWRSFIDGLEERLKEEAQKNNLIPHIEGFCEFIDANPAEVMGYILHHKWESLVVYLMHVK